MTLLDKLSMGQLLWMVPVFFALHNLEETPFMKGWSKRLPLKFHPTITTRQFTVAVTFLTLAGFVITYFGLEYLHDPAGYLLVLGIQAILLLMHLSPTLDL